MMLLEDPCEVQSPSILFGIVSFPTMDKRNKNYLETNKYFICVLLLFKSKSNSSQILQQTYCEAIITIHY